MSNKKLGNSFEQEFCEILFEKGFWVHNLAQNASGQPADVIAVRQGIAHLIDCKVCSNGKFPLSRIEENQHMAMRMWMSCGNGSAWFALKVGDDIYMIEYTSLVLLRQHTTTLQACDIYSVCTHIDDWMNWGNNA